MMIPETQSWSRVIDVWICRSSEAVPQARHLRLTVDYCILLPYPTIHLADFRPPPWLCHVLGCHCSIQDLVGAACEIFVVGAGKLSHVMWDIASWPGMEPSPPTLAAGCLSHWTTGSPWGHVVKSSSELAGAQELICRTPRDEQTPLWEALAWEHTSYF